MALLAHALGSIIQPGRDSTGPARIKAMTRPKPQKDFMTQSEVASRMGISLAKFRDRREDLIEDHAFPVPMPYSASPLIWRRDMVEAWLNEQGRPKHLPPAPRPSGPNVVLMEEAQRA